MSQSITIPTLKCLRCGHSWLQRTQNTPRMCPACKSYKWQEPKAEKGE